ncbi:MAG: Unknown protein [uncultured Sulfurovum sp.]|uniref:Uncharacterized protein n=1 Tax=uncultured Sulfurovum sp. TaxID=269237 RepID=A0A6S6SID8_9BACT|nr:MAG: Unknown protein [uncultured Sulfurovum sp.]
MTKVLLILFTILSIISIYATYNGIGLQEVVSEDKKSVRSYRSGYSGGWSSGK